MSEASREFVDALEGLMESFQQEQRGVLLDRKLTLVRFFVLRWLAKAPGANMSSLAALLGVRPQTFTPIVDSLESEGLLRRVRSTEDRRESHLELTPKGSRVIDSIRASFREKLGQALDEAPPSSIRTAAQALRIAAASLDRTRATPAVARHETG
ncbi:MAG: MarR family winged helix-turn-helix transcriptional regulator [Candidatus Lutacidiplasmatales archaeon]